MRRMFSTSDPLINSLTGKPMHDEFVETTRRFADIIVPHERVNHVIVDLLINKILSRLS